MVNDLQFADGTESSDSKERLLNPAALYFFLKNYALQNGFGDEGGSVMAVPLPDSQESYGDFFNPKGVNGYFVQTRMNGILIDGGVATRNKFDPKILVFTAVAPKGECSEYALATGNDTQEHRTISSRKLGVVERVTIEDIVQFGGSWTQEQKNEVLTTAVRQHYQDKSR